MGREEIKRKDLKEIGTCLKGVNKEAMVDYDVGRLCVAVLVSGNLVLHSVVSSSSSCSN